MADGRERILFISSQPFFQWRGSPIRVGFNVQALAETGYAVDLLTLPLGAPREIPGVRILRVGNPLRLNNIAIGPSLSKLLFDALLFFRGLVLAVRNRYKVVHGVEDAGLVALAIARLTGAKFVFEKHSDPASYRKKALRNLVMASYAAVERFMVRRADATIGTGPGLVAQAEKLGARGPVHHIFDIPSSLARAAPDQVEAARRKLVRAPGDILVLYVGSFAAYQGIDLMFDAMPPVFRRSARARWVVVGGAPLEIEQRKAWLANWNIEERVAFPGKIHPDELAACLEAADILLSPRISGVNTPLKLLDYCKAGRAIVATDNSANRQILNEECALFAPPGPEAFADAILRLIEDNALRERLGRGAFRLFEEKYNYGRFKELLAACYAGL
ncbi:MAG: glycosyltransferase family 4 protein [Lentisphaerae bacterium]|nr:glycosyltransferase family 4 protein [Lentisphaerota bacterium]